MLDLTASLAIENSIQDACDRGLQVFIVGGDPGKDFLYISSDT